MDTKVRLVLLVSLFCAGTLVSLPALSASTQNADAEGDAQTAGRDAQSPCADVAPVQTGLSAMELRKILHDPALNAGDGLGDYVDDLSAYHEPGNRVVPVTGKGTPQDSQQAEDSAVTTGALDLQALRGFFHDPTFHLGDGLGDYIDDLSLCCAGGAGGALVRDQP